MKKENWLPRHGARTRIAEMGSVERDGRFGSANPSEEPSFMHYVSAVNPNRIVRCSALSFGECNASP
eukprot:1177205-Prorocentrum_minimum.AAC.3